MYRRPSVSVNSAGTVVMSGMYGSRAASRTTSRSASTNGRSLNGPAASAGTTSPSLIWPVSPGGRAGAGMGTQAADRSPALAGLGGRQAQLAADHAHRFLHRLVGRGEPGFVPVELAQGGAGRCRRGEPGAGLVGGHQQAGHRFGCRREVERQQAPGELALELPAATETLARLLVTANAA